jgi:exopolysaccharide biosynthesis polyprenyl glycosylphosphotransferase
VNSRNRDIFIVLQYFADMLAVCLGLLAAYWLKFHSGLDPAATVSADYRVQFWWAFLLWLLCLQFGGAVQAHPRVFSFNRARRLLRASALAVLLCAVRNYFFRDPDVSRVLYPMSFVLVTLALVAGRALLQMFISRFLMTKGVLSRVLIVGQGPVAIRLAARFKTMPELGYEIVGFVTHGTPDRRRMIGGIPVVGNTEDLRRLVRDHRVDEVFVTHADLEGETFFQLFMDGDRETARMSFVPSLADMMRSPIHYDEVAGVPVYSMRETPLQGANAGVKRAMDVIGAALGLLVISPMLLVIALLVRRSSPGPILYKQTRLGLAGEEFKIYKFRTMRADAEKGGIGWGAQDDNRSTRIGQWLRRSNLDELPQLWNVLRGDMSLVGPRPERPYYVQSFREVIPRYMSRHAVKTGMTGWAQVHGLRGDTSIQQRLRYDLYYIENWSLWLDIKILMMTFLPKRHRPRRGAPLPGNLPPLAQPSLRQSTEPKA